MPNPLATLRRRLLAAALLLSVTPAFALPPQQTPQAAKPTPTAKAAPPAKAAPAAKPAVADADKLDLNTATPDQLKALPGIGDAYAKRIIDGRPYTAKNQLTTRGILPPKTYEAIKDSIVARRPARK